jgi:hypothetical protein
MQFMAANSSTTGPVCDTPREAAIKFFERYPLKRRCSIAEGYMQAGLFISPMSGRRWLDVTRKVIPLILGDDHETHNNL